MEDSDEEFTSAMKRFIDGDDDLEAQMNNYLRSLTKQKQKRQMT